MKYVVHNMPSNTIVKVACPTCSTSLKVNVPGNKDIRKIDESAETGWFTGNYDSKHKCSNGHSVYVFYE